MLVSTCKKLSCLSACKKINFINMFFLKRLQKYYQLPILGIWKCLGTPINNIMSSYRSFDVYQHALHLWLFFFRYCEDITLLTCYSEDFDDAWSCPSIMTVSSCRKLWCRKCWNQLAGNFDVYLHAKTQLHL